MGDNDAVSDEQRIFEFICRDIGQSLRRIEVSRGEVTIHAAKDSELLVWKNKEKCGFRRLTRDFSTWTLSDTHKFAMLIRGPTTFFAEMHDDSVTFYSSRTSLI